jgi:hypothetical protein
MTRVIAALALISVCACAEELPKVQNPFENKNGNFVLYVSNQSFEVKTVDILVSIDGMPVLHEYFEVRNQHLWKPFRFQLPNGHHTIRAVTRRGGAEAEESFEVAGKCRAMLSFCYGKKQGHKCNKPSFAFEVSDKPALFL